MRKKIITIMLITILMNIKGFVVYADNTKNIFKENNLIAHACGSIEINNKKIAYTNSKEAFMNSKNNNYRLIEVDVAKTKDNKFVCTHNKKEAKKYPYKKWKTKKNIGYSNISLITLLKQIKNTNIMLIIDMKCFKTDKDYINNYKKILKLAKQIGGKNLVNQIIPQVYNMNQIKKINKVYKFKSLIFTMYKYKNLHKDSLYKIIKKVSKYNNITIITLPKSRINIDIINYIHQFNKLIFVHTVNSLEELNQLNNNGVDGYYTDFITPSMINQNNDNITY